MSITRLIRSPLLLEHRFVTGTGTGPWLVPALAYSVTRVKPAFPDLVSHLDVMIFGQSEFQSDILMRYYLKRRLGFETLSNPSLVHGMSVHFRSCATASDALYNSADVSAQRL